MADITRPIAAERPRVGWRTWRRWVLANVVGEVVGFGLAAAIGATAAPLVERAEDIYQLLIGVGVVAAVGIVEGSVVGFAQWLALRLALPGLTPRAWVGATVAGAIAAWGAGMAIGTLAGDRLGAFAGASPLLAAALIGAVAGTLLSVFQWLVLRRSLRSAGRWVPVHAIAWALGMVVAFAGMGSVPDDAPIVIVAAVGGATGLAMGAGVAALTGLALIHLLRKEAVGGGVR